MDLSRFKEIEEKKVEHLKYAEQLKHAKLDTLDLKETMYSVTKTLISFLEGNTTKAVVLNQIRDFATSQDAAQLTQSIESLHDTLKTHENTDITPLTEVMNRVLEEVSKVPEGIKIPEQKFVDYSKQLDQLAKAVGLVEKAIESQETTVQAPEVNVAPAEVNVQAPDLKPLTKEIDKAFKKAIGTIKIPEVPKTDLTKLEKESKEHTKLLKDIRELSSSGGGGGSSSIAPFLNSEGELPIASTSLDLQVDDTGTYTYLGNAAPGTATSESLWRIKRVTNATGVITHADGTSSFTKEWDERASYSY